MSLRPLILCLVLAGLVAPGAAAQVPTAASVATTNALFAEYCAAGTDKVPTDRNAWFCDRSFSAAQKWEVLAGYCWEERGRTRPHATTFKNQKTAPGVVGDVNRRVNLCEKLKTTPIPLSIEYDHAAQEWLPETGSFSVWDRRLEIDPVTGIPTAHLQNRDVIGVTIVRTNPLVYVASRGIAREETIQSVQDLDKLLGLVGGVLPGLARLAVNPGPFGINAFDAGRTVRTELNEAVSALNDLTARTRDLAEQIERLARVRSVLQVLAQNLEAGPAEYPGNFVDDATGLDEWAAKYIALREALAAPRFEDCRPLLEAFVTVVTGDTAKPFDLQNAAVRFQALRTDPAPESCRLTIYVGELNQHIGGIRQIAEKLANTTPPDDKLLAELRRLMANARTEYLQRTQAVLSLLTALASARDVARQTAATEEATRKAVSALTLVTARARDAAFRRTANGFLVSDRIFVREEQYQTSWTKIRTTPLTVSVNSPYADQVVTSRPKEIATTYKLAREGADRFTVGAAMVITRASTATFAAADLDPATNRTFTTETVVGPTGGITTKDVVANPELKSIIEKERNSRSGTVALMANYRWGGTVSLGFQGGVGLAVKEPVFLTGLSVGFWNVFELGAGCGWFQIKALGEGANGVQQTVRQGVSGNDDIVTRERWHHCLSKDFKRRDAAYLTLAINLLKIPLFRSN